MIQWQEHCGHLVGLDSDSSVPVQLLVTRCTGLRGNATYLPLVRFPEALKCAEDGDVWPLQACDDREMSKTRLEAWYQENLAGDKLDEFLVDNMVESDDR